MLFAAQLILHDMSEQEEPIESDKESESEADNDEEASEEESEAEPSRVELLHELDEVKEQLEALQDERETLESKLKRKAADFANYKKRQETRSKQQKAEAEKRLIKRFLPVRDALVRALDENNDDIESLRDGIELTLSEFDRILESNHISEITPEPGEEPDPKRHEVMMRVDSDVEPGRIVSVFQSGYERDETVIRPAQVSVSDETTDR